MLLKIFPENINDKFIEKAIHVLKNDGVIVIPTDTVYAFACSIHSNAAIERICRLKKVKLEKANFSFVCESLSNISDFSKPMSNEVFRLMKNTLPGPFTYILNANSNVPGIFKSNKKTIGIRVPDNQIALRLVKELGNPLMVASVHDESDEFMDYITDPDEIDARLGSNVDLVIDGGSGSFEPSTVVDCTASEPVLIREGKGKIS
ncbi:MAG: threonylcarbamoyl-AMP synthase [Bacteroidetes bacterium]|nr:MAG: threonylcarbamoyl-AMP synthase [Bacteroidota bacterium]REK08128.1 MAG: threonylcarbamoyl-AMP synthase [Bacteroidota bacterium]REK32333.1 MAG: threonylcarbamoyl-AMP synthase [Bacteroidota bacterium]REK49567.1 MAG: threonylcarbamoyl-AMP synthase [Bacteroidota bacterium]